MPLMTTRSMSMTARSTATSNDFARSSKPPTKPSTPSKHSMVSDIAIGNRERPLGRRMTLEGSRPRRFSSLAWRIFIFNAVALTILIGGVLYVQSSRVGLVDERMRSIRAQAEIVAGTLAEYATDENTHSIKVDDAEPLLRQ